MNIFIYDKTFEGLLTLVFDAYESKLSPDIIVGDSEPFQESFFDIKHVVTSSTSKSNRVLNLLEKKLSKKAQLMIFRTFLSNQSNIEKLIFDYLKLCIDSRFCIEHNYRESCVIDLKKVDQRVSLEAMKMISFVRFQKTSDEMFYATIDPDNNVLPLMVKHFKNRYANQKWIIYDSKRKYGIYYDLYSTQEIFIENFDANKLNGKLNNNLLSEDDVEYQNLWKKYYKSINIEERKNSKQQLRLMPRRYWKYLIERQ
ncbi:MAG TPA: DNA metabolism protein [Bacteroidales bacterium]|nr:MAG: hypothetical protein A2W98_00145 [Bacteroidetes bacterium GWF2_33_38]HBF87938.1 DNA metabolism protein [Bacteroidales bacterium]